MIKFDSKEFELFIEIAEFLITLKGEKIPTTVAGYREAIGILVDSADGIKNTLLKEGVHTISTKAFKAFQASFQQIAKDFQTDKNRREIERFRSQLGELVQAVKLKGNTGLNSKPSSNIPAPPSQILVTDDHAGAPNFLKETIGKYKWFIYERLRVGVGRNVITFSQLNDDVLGVHIETPNNTTSWTGTARLDQSKRLLVIQTLKSNESNSPSTFLIRIDVEAKWLDLCVGHVSFLSRLKSNVISKTVMLQKIDKEQAEAAIFTNQALAATAKVSPAIVRFFVDKKLNRLSSPNREIITNLTSLKRWHNQNDEEKRKHRNKTLLGDYSIFYRGEMFEKNLTEDTLSIRENITCDLVAQYSHRLDKYNIQLSEGQVSYSSTTKSAFIYLTGPIGKSEAEKTNSTFIILNLPAGERKFEVLTGIISGIRDTYDGCIGLMIVAVKKKSKAHEVKKDDVRIVNFFETFAQRAIVKPPELPVSTFEDLATCFPEGTETVKHLKDYLKNFGSF